MSYCLKFADEAEFSQHKALLGIQNVDDKDVVPSGVDVIGVLYKIENEIPVAIAGYHVNTLFKPCEELQPFMLWPVFPRRVFFGVELSYPSPESDEVMTCS